MARSEWHMLAPKLLRVAVLAAVSSGLLVASSAGQQEPAGPATAMAVVYTAPPSVSAAERMRLRDGLAAAESNDWGGLSRLRDTASDPLVRRMLQWRLAIDSDAPLYFNDLREALNDLQDWPGRAGMRARAEQAIFDTRLSPSERVGFLRQEGGPMTGDGRIALALALNEMGQRSEANAIARAAWREDSLSSNAESRALDTFSSALSAEDHAARVDILLWRGQRNAAQRLLSRVSTADRLVANARIAMQSRARRGLQAAVDAVPSSRQDDPGFVYDRMQYRRRAGNPEDAVSLAVNLDPSSGRWRRATTSSANAASICRGSCAPAIIAKLIAWSPITA
ncbi:MAG: hypothetical protein R3C16_00780 [Hyphomonadaceae bacterium]